MLYIYEDWELIPNTVRGRIEVDYKRIGDTHTIKLIKFDVRYPIYGIEVLQQGTLRIKQGRSQHAIKTGVDYFVLYPYRNGKPFIFERAKT